jgi:hypothetical protein
MDSQRGWFFLENQRVFFKAWRKGTIVSLKHLRSGLPYITPGHFNTIVTVRRCSACISASSLYLRVKRVNPWGLTRSKERRGRLAVASFPLEIKYLLNDPLLDFWQIKPGIANLKDGIARL